jgi:hypothetical protein
LVGGSGIFLLVEILVYGGAAYWFFLSIGFSFLPPFGPELTLSDLCFPAETEPFFSDFTFFFS